MKKFALAALMGCLVSAPASAQNCQFIGNQMFCDNGLNGQRIGNNTF